MANVVYPGVYQRFLDIVDVLNFDLTWVLSAGCVVDVDFHDRLLISTTGPIVVMLLLGVIYTVARRMHRGSEHAIRNVEHKHVSMVLLVTFLVYSSVSATVFQMFACEDLDDDKQYLRADYRIECTSSKHRAVRVYAGFMVALYPVGIPVFYAFLLLRNQTLLKDNNTSRRASDSRLRSISNLWEPYKPSAYYYELLECGRRILLTGAVVFMYPDTAAQLAVTLMLAFFFAMVAEGLVPYVSRWDIWVSRLGHVVVFVSMFVALLLKVDVSDESDDSQRIFEAVLVAAHACMVLAILVETGVLVCVARRELGWTGQREDPGPRFGIGKKIFGWLKNGMRPAENSSMEDSVDCEHDLGTHAGAPIE